MMSVDSPEFNRFTNDHILREWDAMTPAHVAGALGGSKELHNPKTRAITCERSTQNQIGTFRCLIRAMSSAFASRIDLTSTRYAASRPTNPSPKEAADADRT